MVERAPSTLNYIPEKFVQIIQRKEVIELLNRINEEYYYWHVVKNLPMPNDLTPRDVWTIAKIRRRLTPNRLQFGLYHFHWNTNNKIQELLHFLDMNVGGTLESPYSIPNEDKGRYLVSSIMEEAIASSQIEGAVTTRKKAKEMLRQNKKPTNKSEQMILNNYTTIKRIVEIKNDTLTKDNLLEIHKLITAETFSNKTEEGRYRQDDDIDVVDTATGEVVHHPPDKDDIEVLMADLFRFFNDDESKIFIHPLIKACIIHFMVGFIHPFADGNGRTARALFYWYLLKKGYWLTEYLSISRLILKARAQYARAFQFTEVDEHDATYFILFNLKVMKSAFDELRLYIQKKNEEQRQLSNFIGVDDISYRQSVILEWLYKEPNLLLTVKEVQTRLGVSNGSARNDINALVEKEYLQSVNINKVTNGYRKGYKYAGLLQSRQATKEGKN